MATVKEMLNDLATKLKGVRDLDPTAMQRMKKAQEAASKAGKEVRAEKG